MPKSLSELFQEPFADFLYQFLITQKWLDPSEIPTGKLNHDRFLQRSVAPHVLALSSLFNRRNTDPESTELGLDRYWHQSSNPQHLRLAYFLYFMPANLYRVAAVWCELARLGYRIETPPPSGSVARKKGERSVSSAGPSGSFRAVEFGAGPATASAGVLAGEAMASLGLPAAGNWALIEQDAKLANLGAAFLSDFSAFLATQPGLSPGAHLPADSRVFVRQIDLGRGFLPLSAPRFHLWLMSYALNEFNETPEMLARSLHESWEKHLEDEGLVILVEPALKEQSRKLLEIRKHLINRFETSPNGANYKVLLPCLGHQSCGALTEPTDWCHEEATWWRAQYTKKIDSFCHLDRKTLPFSYLVIAKSRKTLPELLPALGQKGNSLHRLVSPAHSEGSDSEFYICGQDGKRRARLNEKHGEVARGSLLIGAQLRGAVAATRIDRVEKILP